MQMIKMSAVTLQLLRFNLSSWYPLPLDNYLKKWTCATFTLKIPRVLDSNSFHFSHFTCRTLTKMQTGLAESLLKPLRLDWKSPKGTMCSLSTCLRVVLRKFKSTWNHYETILWYHNQHVCFLFGQICELTLIFSFIEKIHK